LASVQVLCHWEVLREVVALDKVSAQLVETNLLEEEVVTAGGIWVAKEEGEIME
jgi:hypothetical protein